MFYKNLPHFKSIVHQAQYSVHFEKEKTEHQTP